MSANIPYRAWHYDQNNVRTELNMVRGSMSEEVDGNTAGISLSASAQFIFDSPPPPLFWARGLIEIEPAEGPGLIPYTFHTTFISHGAVGSKWLVDWRGGSGVDVLAAQQELTGVTISAGANILSWWNANRTVQLTTTAPWPGNPATVTALEVSFGQSADTTLLNLLQQCGLSGPQPGPMGTVTARMMPFQPVEMTIPARQIVESLEQGYDMTTWPDSIVLLSSTDGTSGSAQHAPWRRFAVTRGITTQAPQSGLLLEAGRLLNSAGIAAGNLRFRTTNQRLTVLHAASIDGILWRDWSHVTFGAQSINTDLMDGVRNVSATALNLDIP